jgi:hypothetical protein
MTKATFPMVYKDLETFNQYNWQGLTHGQLLCIAGALAAKLDTPHE